MSITIMANDFPLEEFRKLTDTATKASSVASSFRRSSVRELSKLFTAKELADISAEDKKDESGDVPGITPTSTESADKIDRAYDDTTSKGRPDGLFRSCMQAIRSSHHEARQIRTALIVLGLFTDAALYRDWLSVFYAVIYELEIKMRSSEFATILHDEPSEAKRLEELRKLGEKYYFTHLYELDLAHLYSCSLSSVRDKVEECLRDKPNARKFRDHVHKMTNASDIAGALFCLWGVFIVGGGATARQRARKMCGEEAIHVYQNVSGPGREKRKTDFIEFWDALVSPSDAQQFMQVTSSAEVSMRMMNATIKDLSANPWWLKWLSSLTVIFAGAFLATVYSHLSK